MNILILSQFFSPENFRINDIAKNLVRNGHKVTVLTGIPNYPSGKFYDGYGFWQNNIIENYHGVKVIRCRIYPRKNGSKINLVLNYLSFAISSSFKILSLRKHNFDVSLAFAVSPITVVLPAIFLKKIKSIPVVTWVQDLWPESVIAASDLRNEYVLKSIEKLVQFIYKNSDKILVSSKGMINSIKQKNVNEQKISYLPQWAEDVFEKNMILENQLISFPQGFKVVFAGNIGNAQDIPAILETAKILRDNEDIHFIFVGSGSMRDWLSRKVQKFKLTNNVHLIGPFTIEAMPYIYSKADALLVSLGVSPVSSITVPGKIQSYLASGKPILTMLDGEGSNLIKESKAGLTASSGDYSLLSKNIIKCKSYSQNERLEIGQNGKKFYMRNFKKDIIMKKLEDQLMKVGKL